MKCKLTVELETINPSKVAEFLKLAHNFAAQHKPLSLMVECRDRCYYSNGDWKPLQQKGKS